MDKIRYKFGKHQKLWHYGYSHDGLLGNVLCAGSCYIGVADIIEEFDWHEGHLRKLYEDSRSRIVEKTGK